MPFFPPALQTPAPAQAPAPAPKPANPNLPPGFKPEFRFIVRPWSTVELGSVGPTEKIQRQWELENRSEAPITFKVSDLSPGVIVPGDPFKDPIPPHAKRAFSIQVDATGWEGYQRRAIRLVSDDPKQPIYNVRFDMTVRPDLSVDDYTRKLPGVAPYESPQAVFTFKRETGDPLEIKLASQLPPYLEAEVVPKGAVSEVRLTLRATKVPAGQLSGLDILKVTTNVVRQPSFDLYLDWSIKLPVTPTPSRVVFDDPKAVETELKLEGGKPFKILAADLQATGFELGALPSAEAKVQTLKVRRVKADAKDGFLVLTLSGVDDPIKIPVIWADPSRK